MGIVRHSPAECAALRRAGRAAAETLRVVTDRIRAGVRTADIDAWVRADTERRGGRPSQLGYHGFPAAVCTSVNEVVCHGIPSRGRLLREGDIVNVDVTTALGGFHGDTSVTVEVGRVSAEARHVVQVAREALARGIEVVAPGRRLGDVGAAIESYVLAEGCAIVRDYGGHGIGRAMHMAPHVHHHGPPDRGLRLRPGMALTLEPMVTLGPKELRVLEDGWTVVTVDGSPSAQFEHTLLVTESGCEVLTTVG